jgi:hypothetical protein
MGQCRFPVRRDEDIVNGSAYLSGWQHVGHVDGSFEN